MSKSNLSFDVSLLCGSAIPFHTFNIILRFSHTINIATTEEALSFGVSLFSCFKKRLQCFAIPFDCLGTILRNTFTIVITTTES